MGVRQVELRGCVRLTGYWRVRAWRNRLLIAEKIIPNIIVNNGLYLLGDMIREASGYDTGLTYMALGTGTATPLAADTQLTTEVARKAITGSSRSGAAVTISTFWTAAQSTYNIKEVGLFGHSTASATANSGMLFTHALLSYDNSAGLYDLTFDYVLTLARG